MYGDCSASRSAHITPVRRAIVPFSPDSASDAFVIRFITTCRTCVASASTGGTSRPKSNCNDAFFEITVCSRCAISDTSAERSSGRTTKRPRPE